MHAAALGLPRQPAKAQAGRGDFRLDQTIANFRSTRYRDRALTQFAAYLVGAAYNLPRIARRRGARMTSDFQNRLPARKRGKRRNSHNLRYHPSCSVGLLSAVGWSEFSTLETQDSRHR